MLRPLSLSLVLLFSSVAIADTLHIPVGEQGASSLSVPHRGESKGRVLERFGLADKEYPSVGQPPITRWDYRLFTVYFENDRVINSVIHHQPRNQPQTGQVP